MKIFTNNKIPTLLLGLAMLPALLWAQEPDGEKAAVASAPKTLNVRQVQAVPQIDGMIEDLWQQADSVSDFVQHQPYENTEPGERTLVYLMQDDENLYVAFRCHAVKNPPVACFTKDEDYVTVKFDPFGSRTNGYFFLVFGSGLFWDGLIMDDGRSQDQSWEGVWYNAVKMYPDRMEVEMKIPFKTLRYKKGLGEWNIQFARHIATTFEDDYWTSVNQKDGDLVSRWGTATNINPKSSGYYFELYPEGFYRFEDFRGKTAEGKFKGSLTAKWDLTPADQHQRNGLSRFCPDRIGPVLGEPLTLPHLPPGTASVLRRGPGDIPVF